MTSRLFYLGLSALIVLADQISKWAISEHVMRPLLNATRPQGFFDWYLDTPSKMDFARLEVFPFFNLVMVWNHGISFGLFNRETDIGPLLLIGVALAVTIWFTAWLFRTGDRVQSLGLAMVIGGALGNVIDRLRFGAVMDFLDVHALGWHWPAFNLADSAIVIGVGLLLVHALFLEKKLS